MEVNHQSYKTRICMSHADHNTTCLPRKRKVLLTWQKAGEKQFVIYQVCLCGIYKNKHIKYIKIPDLLSSQRYLVEVRGWILSHHIKKLQTYLLQCKTLWLGTQRGVTGKKIPKYRWIRISARTLQLCKYMKEEKPVRMPVVCC